jgi:hypothetical protein
MPDPQVLIVRIEQAFANVLYPGDEELIYDASYGDEPEATKRSFTGKADWRALDAAFLNRALNGSGGALAFLTDRAFVFYLPAYLIADIRGELQVDDPANRICAWITPQSEGARVAKVWGGRTMGDRARATFSLLNQEQRSCVVDYLLWRLERGDGDTLTIQQALEHEFARIKKG